MKSLLILTLILTPACGSSDSSDPAPATEQESTDTTDTDTDKDTTPETPTVQTTLTVDGPTEDVCTSTVVDIGDECFLNFARLDIYTDGSKVLQLQYLHKKADGSGTPVTVTGKAAKGEQIKLVVDIELKEGYTAGVMLWAVSSADNKFLDLVHDTDANGRLDASDYIFDSIAY